MTHPDVEIIWNYWPLTWMPWFWTPWRFFFNAIFFFFIPYVLQSPFMFIWNIIPSQLQWFGSMILAILMWVGYFVFALVTMIFIVTIPFNAIGIILSPFLTFLVWSGINFNTMTIW